MRRRSPKAADLSFEFGSLGLGRITWIGLTLAMIGWALLITGAVTADLTNVKGFRSLPPTFHGDFVEIAKAMIESGLAVAIVGALKNGFGTLNRFFGAVLSRSGQREPVAKPVASIEGRPYRVFPDGSVEVETIVGTRLFKTMAEAREFI